MQSRFDCSKLHLHMRRRNLAQNCVLCQHSKQSRRFDHTQSIQYDIAHYSNAVYLAGSRAQCDYSRLGVEFYL